MEKIVKSVAKLDMNTSKGFEADVMAAITEDCDRLVIDMQDTNYISSICLRTLRNGFKKMKSKGGEFVLRNVNPPVMEILEITGFAGNFTIE